MPRLKRFCGECSRVSATTRWCWICSLTRSPMPDVTRMRAALQSRSLEPAQRVRVHLALGKAAEDLGDYEEAMRQFDAAESVRNGIVRFDLTKFETRVDRLIEHFTPELLSRASACGREEATPILVFGLPR